MSDAVRIDGSGGSVEVKRCGPPGCVGLEVVGVALRGGASLLVLRPDEARRVVEAIQRLLPVPVLPGVGYGRGPVQKAITEAYWAERRAAESLVSGGGDPFVQLEQHRQARQEAQGDYLREQLQQHSARKAEQGRFVAHAQDLCRDISESCGARAQTIQDRAILSSEPSPAEVASVAKELGRAQETMADRARTADQLNTGAPNDCAGSTTCDHAAGLCGAMGTGGGED